MYEEHQECRDCGQDLPIQEFHKSNKHRSGRLTQCRKCRAATRPDKGKPVPAWSDRLDAIQESDLIRFSDLYEPTEDGHWIWRGAIASRYPVFWFSRGRVRAHRFALAASGVELTEHDHAHHLCGIPTCVRPDHLTALSPEDHREAHRELGKRRPRKTRRKKVGGRSA